MILQLANAAENPSVSKVTGNAAKTVWPLSKWKGYVSKASVHSRANRSATHRRKYRQVAGEPFVLPPVMNTLGAKPQDQTAAGDYYA